MSSWSLAFCAGLAVGVFIGAALQRSRRAWRDWRRAVLVMRTMRTMWWLDLRRAVMTVAAASGLVLVVVLRF